MYRFVATDAPTVSYTYPSLDKNNWVPILYSGKAIQKPYRVIFNVTNVETVEDVQVLPVTIVDIATNISDPGRYTKQLIVGSVGANQRVTGTVRLQPIASLFSVRSTNSIRIRLYDTSEHRTADLTRPVGTEPLDNHGVLLDITITPDIINSGYQLYPPVTLINNDTIKSGLIYYTIDEVNGSNQDGIILEFNYFAIESELILPIGYLRRHYKFYRDTATSTKRRNYLGCLQTQDTTIDGKPPVEVTITAGTSITVSPNILVSEQNLGGTNLNV
jgi:hypothetical protein